MPNPKRRHSQQRSAKRNSHNSLKTPALSKDAVTGEIHLRHCAHIHEGKLYYRGRVVTAELPSVLKK